MSENLESGGGMLITKKYLLQKKLRLNLCLLYACANVNLKYRFKDFQNTLLSQHNVIFFIFSLKTLFIMEHTALQEALFDGLSRS